MVDDLGQVVDMRVSGMATCAEMHLGGYENRKDTVEMSALIASRDEA